MPMTDLLSAAGALALVIGLIVLLRFGSRFVGMGRLRPANTPLILAGQLALDGRRRLHLVGCGSGQVLVLTGGVTDVMLVWPQAPPGPETPSWPGLEMSS
ncbi:hypothetical protein [Lichenicola sp.]|uniref:hypothetical protein n=1 Tax=Lichenicola sp. TaxID=2804529 RepID=UPI003B0006FC